MLIAAVLALAVSGPTSTTSTASVSRPLVVRVRVEATCTVAAQATACRGALGAGPLVDRIESEPSGERRRLVAY